VRGSRIRKVIEQVYPGTQVPLDEEERRFKHGQFGYGKYVYPDNVMTEVREFFERQIGVVLPHARILCIV